MEVRVPRTQRTSCAVARLTLLALASAFAAETISGQSEAPPQHTIRPDIPLLALDPTLQTGLERIASRSALWREAIDAVRNAGRYALVLTPGQVVVRDSADGETSEFDPTVLAEVTPVLEDDSRVISVIVVVNVPLLEKVHHAKGSLPGEFFADLDRILVHEIYGHAVPYLVAGDLSGRCADPQPNERASDACAIRRENAVRAELRLGRRTDAGLAGLALADRFR